MGILYVLATAGTLDEKKQDQIKDGTENGNRLSGEEMSCLRGFLPAAGVTRRTGTVPGRAAVPDGVPDKLIR